LHFTKATVEHIVPLCELVDRFLQSRGLDRTAKPTGSVLKEWREFHRKNAKLKLVSSGYNQLTAVEIWKERETYRKKITREWGNNYSCHNLQ
jgi:hypothetical protein